MFFKKQNKITLNKTKTLDFILDKRLEEFSEKMKNLSKSKDKAVLLSWHFTRLIKAEKSL